MYQDIPMSQRLDKIGELLAKGAYLCIKKECSSADKRQNVVIKDTIRLKTNLPQKLRKRKI